MSLIKYLITERIIHHSSIEDMVEYLRDNNINVSEKVDYYIDSGANGDVYSVDGSNKVLKIERFHNELFNINKKLSEIQSDNIVNYYFVKRAGDFIISVMEYLKPSADYINYRDKFFETFIMFIEDALRSDHNFMTYKDTNVYSARRILLNNNFNEDLVDKLINEFNTGDEILLRCILTVILKKRYQIGDNDIFLEDVINNKKFISDIFYGLNDIMDEDIKHGDVHVDNVLYDERTQNFKLIDPWVL